LTAPTLRVVAADVTVIWDGGNPVFIKKGTLVSLVAGSALETAYGGPGNTPLLEPAQREDAAEGTDRAGVTN
jgi:hypothetical protein